MVNDGRIVTIIELGSYVLCIYQKIASGAQKTAPAPRYDWLIEVDDFSIPSRSRPGPALKKCMCWLQPSN